jgi:hypothetical protein
VPVERRGDSLAVGVATPLYQGPYFRVQTGRTYDVSPDGRRFLMIRNAAPATEQQPTTLPRCSGPPGSGQTNGLRCWTTSGGQDDARPGASGARAGHLNWEVASDRERILTRRLDFKQDTEGLDVELRYFRDVDGREGDFVVTDRRQPILIVECKLTQGALDPSVRYLKGKFPDCPRIVEVAGVDARLPFSSRAAVIGNHSQTPSRSSRSNSFKVAAASWHVRCFSLTCRFRTEEDRQR